MNGELNLNNPNQRILCHFSCGAASAVACKMAIELNKKRDNPLRLEIIRCYVEEEHKDNDRFMSDCEQWFGQEVKVLKNEKYSGSIYQVFYKDKFLVSPNGAACTGKLKKSLREKYQRYGDIHVFGFHLDEEHRLNRFIDSNNDLETWDVLMELGLNKQDCFAILMRQDIKLPAMYRMGYKNNNCIGCVKGGMGYWNKIRDDFPVVFWCMSNVEVHLGRTVLRDKKVDDNGNEYSVPLPLIELEPGRGNYSAEKDIECGVACLMAESNL